MKKFSSLLSIFLVLCMLFSISVFAENADAEETHNPGADKILVDIQQNTITFLYDETNQELMEQWKALPSFEDVPEDYKYQMYISYLSQLGIMDGTTETTFSPEDAITRADLASTIARAENVDVESTGWVSGQGILSVEHSDDPVTHAEAAEMMSQLVKYDIAQTTGNTEFTTTTTLEAPLAQKKIADTLALTGLLDEETDAVIAPDDPLTRAEAAHMMTGYLFYRDKPTFITGTTPISYIKTSDDDFVDASTAPIGDNESFHIELAGFNPEDGVVSPNWTSGGDVNTSVHMKLVNQGLYILSCDKGSTVGGKYTQTALANMLSGSVVPDTIENDGESYKGHYCSPSLLNKNGESNPTAYTRFNNHYYDAKVSYSSGNSSAAYTDLGEAIHYLEDMNSPPHAALIIGDAHRNYEKWVRDDWKANLYWENNASSSTYNFMCNSTFRDISKSFANAAATNASYCVNYFSTSDTAEHLKRTQRAIAGIAYRYLIDTGRI